MVTSDRDEGPNTVERVRTTAEVQGEPGGKGQDMEIVAIYNPRRRRVAVQRQPDNSPRRLVILAGWGMPDAELLRAVRPLLEPGEIAAVAQALGLGGRDRNG